MGSILNHSPPSSVKCPIDLDYYLYSINKRERYLVHWKFIHHVWINLWIHIFNQNVDTCATKIFEDYRFHLLQLERSVNFHIRICMLKTQKYNEKWRTIVMKNSYNITNLFYLPVLWKYLTAIVINSHEILLVTLSQQPISNMQIRSNCKVCCQEAGTCIVIHVYLKQLSKLNATQLEKPVFSHT